MINQTAGDIMNQTSPAEMRHLENGCFATAKWLVDHLVDGLTDFQSDSIAYRLIETVKK